MKARLLLELIKQKGKTIAIFIDNASALTHETFNGIKRMRELVEMHKGVISFILVSPGQTPPGFHMRIQTTLRLDDLIVDQEKEFVEWILDGYTKKNIKPTDVFTQEAMLLLASSYRTPYQIIHYTQKAIELAVKNKSSIVNVEIIEAAIKPERRWELHALPSK